MIKLSLIDYKTTIHNGCWNQKDLLESIKKNGILNPVLVKFDPNTNRYKLHNGRHRLMAAKRLGIEEIPCMLCRPIPLRTEKEEAKPDLSPPYTSERYGHKSKFVEEFIDIPVEYIYTLASRLRWQTQARRSLEEDIRNNGLKEPILVKRISNTKYHVYDGNHRLFVVRSLGWKTVKCKVFLGTFSYQKIVRLNEKRS